MNSLSQSERDKINLLSEKIDTDIAQLDDYVEYENLLLKAGVSQEQISGKMKIYGYNNYSEYIKARKKASSKEERNIVEVIIVAGLVVLSAVVGLLIIAGKLAIREEKKHIIA